MRAVIQRVTSAHVVCNGEYKNEIGCGYMVLLGVSNADTEKEAEKLADKIAKLRVFEDSEGKLNKSILDFQDLKEPYSVLVVSNFTLYANCKGQNRPDFLMAAKPEKANYLYELFVSILNTKYALNVKTGIFRSDMKVSIVNDGPITIVMDTDTL